MQPDLNPAQMLLRDSLRDLVEREAPFEQVRECERSGTADERLWKLLQANGWLSLPFDAATGGEGLGLVEVAVAVHELSRRAAVVPYMETMAACYAMRSDGGIPPGIASAVMAGEMTIAPAILEEDDRPGTVAALVEVGALTGRKWFVDYGQSASHHLVLARVSSGSHGLHLVLAANDSVLATPLDHIGRIPKARVEYRGTVVEQSWGAPVAESLAAVCQALSAAQCIAVAEKALEMTVAYVANRVQFGRPIGTFQAVQHHCANMATMVEAGRFLAYEAVWKLDEGIARAEELATAKAWAAKTAVEVTLLAHQLHGGIGVTEEYDLNFFSRRAKERALAWSSEGESMAVLGRTVDMAEPWV